MRMTFKARSKSIERAGFTLAELLSAMVILGIVGAVAIPKFAAQKERVYAAESLTMIEMILRAQKQNKTEYGQVCSPTATSGVWGVVVCPGATEDERWTNFGVENPNKDPNRNWTYAVYAEEDFWGTTIGIEATRTSVNDHGQAGKKYYYFDWSYEAGYCGGSYFDWPPAEATAYPYRPKSVYEECNVGRA